MFFLYQFHQSQMAIVILQRVAKLICKNMTCREDACSITEFHMKINLSCTLGAMLPFFSQLVKPKINLNNVHKLTIILEAVALQDL
jgi:hypothetical protein